MAVEVESLIVPEGEIEPDLFPDDDAPPAFDEGSLLYRLETYLRKAEEKVAGFPFADPDTAVTHWALYLAFRDAHTGMVARPANEQYLGGLGGHGYSREQIQAVAAKRDEHKAAFDSLVTTATTVETPRGYQTRVVANRFDW